MYIFINILIIFFWIIFFLFFYNIYNIFILFILSEIIWMVLFNISIFLSIYFDNFLLFINNIFILSFATTEFSLGFYLIFLISNFNKIIEKKI